MKRRNIIFGVVLAVAFGLLYYLYGGHSAPTGQKPLTELSAPELQNLRADFNLSVLQPRMIVLLSPT